ncbi:Metalloenzyme, LuxS/M16 peptidase-like protein [Pseudocohnilembus persalinus]|uniref:Metalloenzyme, LuxS/M16 peptidase-like protein n=1 Tax=Pseudocohnilembus persalinus TaxID=266149 RepID=A0A0V0Q9W6_PSEPJ|nr:Metalloenzyme, LuxS/M16 peptidase-like protein [Pseudocohnilembus persalinus]|eukprot:KRW98994.1 Metalloenzyme, LuxS/M16 peptidase-like protein [Pseudocohnilembus persalinus]
MEIEEDYNINNKKPQPAPTNQPQFVLDEYQYSQYYQYFFPIKQFVQWLSYGNDDSKQQDIDKEQLYFKRREFSFNYPGDIYQRYQSFKGEQDFKNQLVENKPEKIDIGAVFKQIPNKNSQNVPQEREFVIDIDMTDYDEVRTCCQEANICSKCWQFMKAAGHIILKALKEDFGFEHYLWVYSGRRGIHLWVCDEYVRLMDNSVRSSVIDNLNLLGGSKKEGSKLKHGLIQNGGKQTHYQLDRAYNILKKYFDNIETNQQIFIKKPEIIKNIIKDKNEKLWQQIESSWNKGNPQKTSQQKIEIIKEEVQKYNDSKENNFKISSDALIKEIVINLLYPRLDVNVSKQMNHLLKAPFSMHPKTGKVCVPFTEQQFDSFDPFSVPSMEELNNHLLQNNGNVSQKLFCTQKTTQSTQIKKIFDGSYSEVIPKILRGKHRVIYDLQPGQQIHNFYVKDIQNLPQFNMKAFYLEHNVTKSKYIHLDCSDYNNVFSFILNTPTKDNKGLPYIIEKLILCGSKKFPVRDPFKEIAHIRSLNTYTEPQTGNGHIIFPFCTKNEKDYYNLMSLYADSIFNAQLNKQDFYNESCRIEFRDPMNENTELVYRGNVYEDVLQMKQIPDQIFQEEIQKRLFKGTDNQFLPTGELNALKSTTYEDVLSYYNTFFKVYNCHFYSYGDMDFTKNLEFLSMTLLNEKQNFKSQEKDLNKNQNQENLNQYNNNQNQQNEKQTHIILPTQKVNIEDIEEQEYTKEVRLNCSPSFGDPNKGSMFGVSFLCNDIIKNPETSVGLNALSYTLFDTPMSPLFEGVLQPGYAGAYCPGYGYDMSNKFGTFTIGFKDLQKDFKVMYEIEKEVTKILTDLSKNGFKNYLIDLSLYQLEVAAKQRYENFGVELLQNMIPYIINNQGVHESEQISPIQLLKLTDFKQLKKQIKDQKLFQNLIKRYILNNPQSVRIMITPYTYYIQDLLQKDSKELEQLKNSYSPMQKKYIIDKTIELEKHLQRIQDTSSLPQLRPTDIEPLVERFEYEEKEVFGCKAIFTDQETNDMSYVKMKFDITDIDKELYNYLEVFKIAFPFFGSLNLKEEKFETLMDLAIQNLSMKDYLIKNEEGEIKKYLILNFNFLNRSNEDAFNLINDILSHPNFNSYNSLSQFLMYHASETNNQIIENTLDFAFGYSSSQINEIDSLNNSMARARQLCDLQIKILKTTGVKQELEKIMKQIKKIYKFIMNKAYSQEEFTPQYKKLYLPLPITSNFVVETFSAPELIDRDRPALHLAGELMRNTILLPELKEKRGAYDAGVYLNYYGTFSFYSFRDPNTLSSYEYFEMAIQYVTNNDFSDSELEEAKVSIFTKLDTEVLPENKGEHLFVYELTDKMKKAYREAILGTTREQLVEATKKYLLDKLSEDQSSKIIIGQQDVNLEGLLKRGWRIERPLDDLSVQQDSYEQVKSEYLKLPEII